MQCSFGVLAAQFMDGPVNRRADWRTAICRQATLCVCEVFTAILPLSVYAQDLSRLQVPHCCQRLLLRGWVDRSRSYKPAAVKIHPTSKRTILLPGEALPSLDRLDWVSLVAFCSVQPVTPAPWRVAEFGLCVGSGGRCSPRPSFNGSGSTSAAQPQPQHHRSSLAASLSPGAVSHHHLLQICQTTATKCSACHAIIMSAQALCC